MNSMEIILVILSFTPIIGGVILCLLEERKELKEMEPLIWKAAINMAGEIYGRLPLDTTVDEFRNPSLVLTKNVLKCRDTILKSNEEERTHLINKYS